LAHRTTSTEENTVTEFLQFIAYVYGTFAQWVADNTLLAIFLGAALVVVISIDEIKAHRVNRRVDETDPNLYH
jgi:hypothetical protein